MEDQERENSEEGAAATEKVIIIHQEGFLLVNLEGLFLVGLIFGRGLLLKFDGKTLQSTYLKIFEMISIMTHLVLPILLCDLQIPVTSTNFSKLVNYHYRRSMSKTNFSRIMPNINKHR